MEPLEPAVLLGVANLEAGPLLPWVQQIADGDAVTDNRKFVQVNQIELACRIMETCVGIKRPPGKTASEAMRDVPTEHRITFVKAADAAIAYLMECVEASGDEAELRYQTHGAGTA